MYLPFWMLMLLLERIETCLNNRGEKPMNDYILAFDDDWSPYIAHAFWNRKKSKWK